MQRTQQLLKSSRSPANWLGGPDRCCPAPLPRRLISRGAQDPALSVLDRSEGASSIPAAAAAAPGCLARSRRWKEAKAVLGELYELGERDPETVGVCPYFDRILRGYW